MEKKIVSKDGSYIELTDNGIHVSTDSPNALALSGAMYGDICNIDEMDYIYRSGNVSKAINKEKYFPVQSKVLRFAKRFKIRQFRLITREEKHTERGWVYRYKYGYIEKSKFERLLRKRKQVDWYGNKVVLLKRTDAVWRDE